jgi:hypothetical protein
MNSRLTGDRQTPTDAVIVRHAAEGPFFHAAKREPDATWSLRFCSAGLWTVNRKDARPNVSAHPEGR